MRNHKRDEINRLRERQERRFSSDRTFDERFDRHFDRMGSNFDKAFEKPAQTVLKFWLVALALNLIFWGLLIAGIFFGLNYFGVI